MGTCCFRGLDVHQNMFLRCQRGKQFLQFFKLSHVQLRALGVRGQDMIGSSSLLEAPLSVVCTTRSGEGVALRLLQGDRPRSVSICEFLTIEACTTSSKLDVYRQSSFTGSAIMLAGMSFVKISLAMSFEMSHRQARLMNAKKLKRCQQLEAQTQRSRTPNERAQFVQGRQ